MTEPKIPRVVVIGGGHAGVEAACASARLGAETYLVSLRKEALGQMSCNPAIGGTGKGHLVKELDALGGVMGRAIDDTGIQFKTLNESKGPAVRSSRAQADRELYRQRICELVATQPNLTVVEGEVAELLIRDKRMTGVRLADGSTIEAESVVATTGTFLSGLMHTGSEQTKGGRRGDRGAYPLSQSLRDAGFELGRLKTGTPPRLRKSTIDFSSLTEHPGDNPPKPFSMMTKAITRPQISCWMTATNEKVHDIIRANRERSPMFNGQIKSGGPRYCPSIEDKVFRFADKTKHNIFLEPEGFESDIVYPNGISTSLPFDVQEQFVRSMKGLEQVEFLAPGYAVEYDFINPQALKPSLETKLIAGFFLAGQINGTSGYEEAAAQGIIAGANAALTARGKTPIILHRGQAYIGVMIDDLITNGVDEPYRMFTARAEYRLILREDNAADRLCPIARAAGLLSDEQWSAFEARKRSVEALKSWSEKTRFKPNAELNTWLAAKGTAALKDGIFAADLVRRPQLTLHDLLEWTSELENHPNADIIARVESELKFSGYLDRQEEDIKRLEKSELELIPEDLNFDLIPGLRQEFKIKLTKIRPHSLGQALRIPGMTPSAITLLALHLKRFSAVTSTEKVFE